MALRSSRKKADLSVSGQPIPPAEADEISRQNEEARRWASLSRLERKRMREKRRRDEFSTSFLTLMNTLTKVDQRFQKEAQLRERRKVGGLQSEGTRKGGEDSDENLLFSRVELIIKASDALDTLHERCLSLESQLAAVTSEKEGGKTDNHHSTNERINHKPSSPPSLLVAEKSDKKRTALREMTTASALEALQQKALSPLHDTSARFLPELRLGRSLSQGQQPGISALGGDSARNLPNLTDLKELLALQNERSRQASALDTALLADLQRLNSPPLTGLSSNPAPSFGSLSSPLPNQLMSATTNSTIGTGNMLNNALLVSQDTRLPQPATVPPSLEAQLLGLQNQGDAGNLAALRLALGDQALMNQHLVPGRDSFTPRSLAKRRKLG